MGIIHNYHTPDYIRPLPDSSPLGRSSADFVMCLIIADKNQACIYAILVLSFEKGTN